VFLQVFEDERYSESLDRYMVHECLRLGYNYDGPTEIGGLILLPEYRGHRASLGRFLSYTRFLFLAMHRPVFRDRVLSELLPPLEPDGTSRLWNHFGRVFTGLTYSEADLLSKDNKEFIKSLFPHGLVYTSLFPDEVREVIGAVGPETMGVEKMLRRIGFEFARTIDPFDGGPHFIAETDRITLVADSRRVVLADQPAEGPERWTIAAVEASSERPRFRAVALTVPRLELGTPLALPRAALDLLRASPGASAWAVSA
jgi:arginine N-succinyltransferase